MKVKKIEILSDGSPWRPLVHCKDIARAFVAFAEAPKEAIHGKAINIGGNNLKNEDLNMIRNSIGRIQLSGDELEDYQRRAKEKEAILDRNKKNKGKKPDEPIPFVEEVTQIEDKFYIVRNMKVRTLNVMQNNFTEEVYETVINMLDISPDLLLTVDNKVFSKGIRERLNHPHSKYANRIYLAK